jgi:peptide/nickel transport system permease protein
MSKALNDQVTPITRRRMFKNKNKSLLTLRISGSILGFLFLVAIFQPFFYTVDPAASDLSLRLQSPSLGGAVLGTDALGQDVYSRVIAGFRWSLGIGTVGTLLGCLIGITLGVSAAWNRKRLRIILSRVIDIGISFPYLIIAVTIVTVVGRGFWPLALTLGLVCWPTIARVVYAETLTLREREYVTAARLFGIGSIRSIFTHILPALRPTIQVVAAFTFAELLIAESGLSFLGLGAPLGTPTWGNMLNESRLYMESAPWMMFGPVTAIILTIFAANLLGEGLNAREQSRSTRVSQ